MITSVENITQVKGSVMSEKWVIWDRENNEYGYYNAEYGWSTRTEKFKAIKFSTKHAADVIIATEYAGDDWFVSVKV